MIVIALLSYMSSFDNMALFLACSIILYVGKMLHICISLYHLNCPDFLKWYVLSGQLAIKYLFCPYKMCDIWYVKISFTNINYECVYSYFSPNSFQILAAKHWIDHPNWHQYYPVSIALHLLVSLLAVMKPT